MRQYLVSVPAYRDQDIKSKALFIKVSEAETSPQSRPATRYPAELIAADAPHVAAFRYARRHGLTNILVTISLFPHTYEEWWMCTDEIHKVDLREDIYWEPRNEK